jgi:hypothetical protein
MLSNFSARWCYIYFSLFSRVVVLLGGDRWSVSNCQQYDSCDTGAINPESASRRSDWLFGLRDSGIGSIRHTVSSVDMDLSFDHKCETVRTKISGGIVPDLDPFEHSYNMAGTQICV